MASGLFFDRSMFRPEADTRSRRPTRRQQHPTRRQQRPTRRKQRRPATTTPDAATTMPGAVKTMPDTETTTPDTETTTPGRNGPNGRTGPNRGKKSPFRAKKEKRWPPMKIFRPRSAERVDLFSYFCKGRFPAKLRSDASPPQFCLTLNKNQLLNLWNTPII